MNYGSTWPPASGRGGPAITTQPAARTRLERVVAFEVVKLDQADTTIVLAAAGPTGGGS